MSNTIADVNKAQTHDEAIEALRAQVAALTQERDEFEAAGRSLAATIDRWRKESELMEPAHLIGKGIIKAMMTGHTIGVGKYNMVYLKKLESFLMIDTTLQGWDSVIASVNDFSELEDYLSGVINRDDTADAPAADETQETATTAPTSTGA